MDSQNNPTAESSDVPDNGSAAQNSEPQVTGAEPVEPATQVAPPPAPPAAAAPSAPIADAPEASAPAAPNGSVLPAPAPDNGPAQPAPGQVAYAAPAAPTNPADSFGGAFPAMWAAFVLIFKGKLVDAFQIGDTYRHYWHVAVGGFIILVSILPAATAIAAANGLNTTFTSVFGSSASLVESPFTLGLKVFFGSLVVFAIITFSFITSLFFTLRVRGVQAPYGRAATVWSVAATPAIFVVAVTALLVIIPSGITYAIGTFFLLATTGIVGMMANIANYVGLNRIAPVHKSYLVPFVLFNMLASVVSAVAVSVFLSSVMS